MADIIIHVGLPKCGSSALQTVLSRNPIQDSSNLKYGKLKYLSLDHLGNVKAVEDLTHAAERSPSGYNASCCFRWDNLNDAKLSELKAKFAALSNNGEHLLVLSCEGWFWLVDEFIKNDFFNKTGLNPHILCYARNPVEWTNSGWWQWGAWENLSLDDYVTKTSNTNLVHWAKNINMWINYVGGTNVTMKILPRDIVADFYSLVEMDVPLVGEFNVSLPEEVLRFFQKFKELRPGGPEDAAIDFILSGVIKFDNSFKKTPWVITPEHIQKILEMTRDSSTKLLEVFEPGSKEICINDPKWWTLSAFDNKVLQPEAMDDYFTIEVLEKLLLATFKGINRSYFERLNGS